MVNLGEWVSLMSEVPLYQHGCHVCTFKEAVSEQDLERNHVHSTLHVQGYLAHEKTHTPRTLPWVHA